MPHLEVDIATPESPDERRDEEELQVLESPPHLEELSTSFTENPSVVNLLSMSDNLLNVYEFQYLDVLRTRHNIRSTPRQNRELIGSGLHELDAPYKIEGVLHDIYTFYEKRSEFSDAIEMSITSFPNWYESLRFSDAINKGISEDDLYQWRFKVIFISSAKFHDADKNPHTPKYLWAVKMAADFYKSIFNRNDADAESIDYALKQSPTIMIVAALCKNKTPVNFHTIKGGNNRSTVRVVACMTYDTGMPDFTKEEPSPDELLPIIILWLAVSDDTVHAPAVFGKTWRRQGFAIFLIVHAIKSMCVLHTRETPPRHFKYPRPVHIYLQCTQSAAYHFYLSCGFVQLNKGRDDGKSLLPKPLLKLVEEHASYWIPYCIPTSDESDDQQSVQELPPCKLMYLQPGHLCHPILSTSDKEKTPSAIVPGTLTEAPERISYEEFSWSFYPLLINQGWDDVQSRLTVEALDNCFLRMHCLEALIPGGMNRGLLPAASLRLTGRMFASRRLLHNKQQNKCWFQSDELELMLALMLRDGRYDDYVATVPIIYAQSIAEASSKHSRYTRLCVLLEEAREKKLPTDQIDALVRRTFNGASAFVISNDYMQQLNYIIKNVIVKSPGMLHKHVIVFPWNKGQHWVVTFVFNPSSLLSDQKSVGDPDGMLQPCFLQYCSLGGQAYLQSTGLIWFLNCAASYLQHTRLNAGYGQDTRGKETPMKWISPFGPSPFEGMPLLGTIGFPRLLLGELNKDCLPVQHDASNCGTGSLAAIGIILRDLFGSIEDFQAFEDAFSTSSMVSVQDSSTGEYTCCLPGNMLKALPSDTELNGVEYLATLRTEWLTVLDRLAHLLHDKLRQGKPTEDYKAVKSIIKWPLDLSSLGRKKKETSTSDTVENLEDSAAVQSLMRLADGSFASRKRKDNPSTNTQTLPPTKGIRKPVLPSAKPRPATSPGKSVATLSLLERIKTPPKKRDKRDMRLPKENKEEGPTLKTASLAPTPGVPIAASLPSDKPSIDKKATSLKKILPSKAPRPHQKPRTQKSRIPIPTFEDSSSEDEPDLHVKEEHDDRTGSTNWPKTEDTWENIVDAELNRNCKNANQTKLAFQWLQDELLLLKKKRIDIPVKTDKDFTSEDLSELSHKMSLLNSAARSHDEVSGEFQEQDGDPPYLDKVAMEAFVQRTFTKDWKWHSEKKHEKYLRWLLQKSEAVSDVAEQKYYKQLHSFAKRERQYYRKRLETKFQCSRQGMLVALKYRRSDNTFTGMVKFSSKVDDQDFEDSSDESVDAGSSEHKKRKPSTDVHSEEVVLETEWVHQAILPDLVDHVMKLESDDGFFNIPQTKEKVLVTAKPIQRIRYVPSQKRHIPDVNAPTQFSKRIHRRRSKVIMERVPKPLPKKEIDVPGYWLARLSDGSTTTVTEDVIVNSFGKQYMEEVRNTHRGFVDIPVGEFKMSHLHLHPHLQEPGAPRIQFVQSDGKDLCVSKALASVFYALNFQEEATKIDEFGEVILGGNVAQALMKVCHFAGTILPTWIQISKMPLHFDWKQLLEDNDTILLGVLYASDGHCNHCVAVHSGYVYDANERMALPLSSDALDYCTSTEDRKSTFVEFRKGYLFSYKGNKQERKSKMQLPRMVL